MKPFKFQIDDISTPGGQNWKQLQENTSTIQWTPTLTSFTGTAPTRKLGIATLYGPLVFFYIRLECDNPSTFGWAAGASFDLPYYVIQNSAGIQLPSACLPPVSNTGLVLTAQAYRPMVESTSYPPRVNMKEANLYTTNSFYMSGQYYRN